jgi:hypothetical protein
MYAESQNIDLNIRFPHLHRIFHFFMIISTMCEKGKTG